MYNIGDKIKFKHRNVVLTGTIEAIKETFLNIPLKNIRYRVNVPLGEGYIILNVKEKNILNKLK